MLSLVIASNCLLSIVVVYDVFLVNKATSKTKSSSKLEETTPKAISSEETTVTKQSSFSGHAALQNKTISSEQTTISKQISSKTDTSTTSSKTDTSKKTDTKTSKENTSTTESKGRKTMNTVLMPAKSSTENQKSQKIDSNEGLNQSTLS